VSMGGVLDSHRHLPRQKVDDPRAGSSVTRRRYAPMRGAPAVVGGVRLALDFCGGRSTRFADPYPSRPAAARQR